MTKDKTKICFVASADITVKFLLLSQLKLLKNNGYDVYVIYSGSKWKEEIEAEGIKVKNIRITRKISPFLDLVSLLKLFLYFKKEKFNAVFTFTPKPGLLGQIAAKMAGTPIICNTIFGFYFSKTTPFLKRRFYIIIEKIAGLCSDIIFFRNFKTAEKEKIGKAALKIYIGDGIDILRFDPKRFSEGFREKKKKELGISPGKIVIGVVARLVKEKGYLELFEAFKKVVEKFPEALLLVAGSADLEKKDSIDINIIKNFGIENNVIFLGERTDIDEIYSLMDIFVLPSWREGFSHSIMEASAMSLPVIATDIRGCRGAVDDQKTGILVPPKNYQKLAEAIMYLLSDAEKAKEMGKNGRKKAEKEFDERLFFDKMEKEYKNFIGKIL